MIMMHLFPYLIVGFLILAIIFVSFALLELIIDIIRRIFFD